MKKVAFAVLALIAGVTNAAELYNNGPVVDGGGKSVLAPGATTLGFGDQAALGNYVADDFRIAAGTSWNVSSLSFYGYQSGAGGFSFTSATWGIFSGDDINTATLLASNAGTVTNGGLSGYRVTPATLTNTQRAIYKVNADITDITLGAGHYWLAWGLKGSGTSGPWQPPTADAREGNALQSLGGDTFEQLSEAGTGLSVELPFAINGTIAAVPEPETYAMLLAGLGLIGVARRRARRA